MLNKCCLCVDLRLGTLIIAGLSIFYSLISILSIYDSIGLRLAIYHVSRGVISLFGFIGVLKNNPKWVQGFAIYYWIITVFGLIEVILFSVFLFLYDPKNICEGMIERHETDMDLETCISYLVKTNTIIAVVLALKFLIEFHFAFVVWAYHQKLRREENGERSVHDDSVSPSSYGAIPNTA